MKLITTIVRPDRVPEVKAALFRAGITGITLSRVSGHGGEHERFEQYRGTALVMEFHEKVKIEMACSEPFVEPCVRAILASARTGEVGDGKIFIQPIERVIRIRTGEEDNAALTAVNADEVQRAAINAAGIEVPCDAGHYFRGDTAWVLVSSALVLLMTVGLAFFYGGLVRPKNALNTMMMSVVALGVIGVQWMLVGYSIAFGPGNPWFGGLSWFGLNHVGADPNPAYAGTIPLQAHAMFQGMFAIITPALISGAIVERMRFRGYVVFLVLWATLIYDPLAHWVWGSGGWLLKRGALDFAGGTVVHISAGVSALVAAWYLGPRRDYRRVPIAPHNVPLVLLGAGLLWFGWFGFNAGSALAANGLAALAFVNTNTAAAAALVTWAGLDLIRTGKVTAVGAATGLVVGLVGITPAAGYVTPVSGLLIGVLAAGLSYTAIQIRSRTKLDDALDVFSCHGIAGIGGALLTGVFATKLVNPAGGDGLLAGNAGQMGVQLLAIVATVAIAALGTLGILALVQATIGARADLPEENAGLDLSQHGEEAYLGTDLGTLAGPGGSLGGSVVVESFAVEPTSAPEPAA